MTLLRVLVVENDGERRLAELIANDPSTELSAVAATGRQAIALTQRLRPDAILMASNVLGVNAFDTTREIMTLAPTPIIVIVDEVGAGAERARARAQEAGALAAVPFPTQSARADRNHTHHGGRAAGTPPSSGRGCDVCRVCCFAAARGATRRDHRRYRRFNRWTGRAARIFAAIPADLEAPILVTQHISSGFSDGMVYWWNAAGPLRTKIAEDGEPLANGTIYVAPDDRHLTISAGHTIALSDAPPNGGHRPSANVMFRSAAERFGAGTFAVILSGMGRDGVDGLEFVHRAGGTVCAQDEASSAVFGMPKAAIDAGIVDFILPLDAISRHIADAVVST